MRISRNLGQALRGLKLNKGNTFLMTLGIMIGIASLTVIVAIGEGTKSKVLNRIANMGFGPESFSVYSGDDATAFDLMSLGGRGNVSVTANIAATQVAEVCRLAIAGDIEGAGKINAELDALNNALFIEPNPIPIKWAMLELGMIKDGIRLPLVALSSKHQETVLNAIRQAGL
mgnify:CR=1 FL=1